MSASRPRSLLNDDFGPTPEFNGDPRLNDVRAALRAGEARRALDLAAAPTSAADGSDGDHAILQAAYRNAARMADVNWFPDQLGASAADGGPALTHVPHQEPVGISTNPAVALERVILDLEVNMRAARTSASIAARYGNLNGNDPVGLGLQSLANLDNLATSMGSEPTRAWCARQASALAALGRDPRAQQLSAAAWSFTGGGTAVRHATSSLLLGDQLFGRPEGMGWNLTSAEVEPLPIRQVVDVARSHWHEALQGYTAAGADWGTGIIAQREGVGLFAVGSLDEAAGCFSAAERALGVCGDQARCRLARAQRVVCDIVRGLPPSGSTEIADELVGWATSVGSRSWAAGIGMIYANAARACGRAGQAELALPLLTLAERVLDGVGFTRDRTQLLLDHAQIAAALGNRAVAGSDLETAFEVVLADTGLAEAGLTETGLAADEAPQPDFMRAMRAVQIAGQVFGTRVAEMDGDAIDRRAARLIEMADRMLALRDATGLPADAPIPDQLSPGMSMEAMLAFGFRLVAEQAQWARDQAAVLSVLYRAVRRRDGGFDDADVLFEQARVAAIAAGSDGGFLHLTVLGQQGRFDEARQLFAAGIADTMADPRMRLELAAAISDWDAAEIAAAEHAQRAGERWWERELNPWEGPVLLAELSAGHGDLVRAVEWAEVASGLFERRSRALASAVHRSSLADNPMVRRLHTIGARCAGDLSARAVTGGDHSSADMWLGRALDFAERGRSRSLGDLLVMTRDPRFAGEGMRSWMQAQATASSAEAHVAAAWRTETEPARRGELQAAGAAAAVALLEAEATLQAQDRDVLQQLRNVRSSPISIEQLRDSLDDETVVIEYVIDGRDVQAIVVGRRGGMSRRWTAATHPGHALARFVRSCRPAERLTASTDPAAPVEQTAASAAAILVDPLADVFARYQRVIIVAQGPAQSVPFHALPLAGQVLVDTHVISYLPMVSLLAGSRSDVPVRSGPRLVIGNPAGIRMPDGGVASPLPHAALEARVVARVGGDDALIGPDATEEAVRSRIAGAAVVHAATHGVVDSVAPMESALMLAAGQALTVGELLGLRLSADLVVLSACDTGRGTVTAGDDVLGLTRGVLAAGARGAVVSLWPVRDDVACVLMCRFSALVHSGMPPAVALATAQRAVRAMGDAAVRDEVVALRAALGAALDAAPDDPAVDGSRAMHRIFGADLVDQIRSPIDPSVWAPFVYIGP